MPIRKHKNRLFVDADKYIEFVMDGHNLAVYKVKQTTNRTFKIRRVVKIYPMPN